MACAYHHTTSHHITPHHTTSHHITPHHTTAHHRTSPHFTARHDTPQREAILMARKPPGPGAPARGKRVPLLIMIVHGKPMGGPRP
jgi:hypothetical protein